MTVEIITRIEALRIYTGLSRSGFARQVGITPSQYHSYTAEKPSKPTVALLLGIVNRWPVDANWLILGEGRMFHHGWEVTDGR